MEASTLTFFYRRFETVFLGAFTGVLLACFPLTFDGQGLIQDPPEGRRDGVEILAPDRVHFQLRAPSKDHVHLRGDFNDWFIGDAALMNRSEDGNTWWLEVDGIAPGEWQRFHYLIDDTLEVADPFAPLILDPWNDGYIQASTFPARPRYPSEVASWPVGALRTEAPEFQWGDADFQRPAQDRLVIYELLVRDWDDAQTFDAVSQRMDHLAWLGITAIELMPVSEFDGNLSWGYNPGPRFAVDKAYGTEDALKRLVDKAHANGIAVILDIVPNHSFGLDPLVRMYQDEDGGISAGNPWFNEDQIHPYGLGSDFDHGDPWTKEFWKRVFDHWLAEFHMDGFRVDLSKGLTQSNTL
ncbi:MAG: alpha-amylase family glycosyl hydrolase, partial [Flavobacteriales bacterium]|nr:alpha-amylase family glycosyl hydrolase [Flavobacteriales bacterium]